MRFSQDISLCRATFYALALILSTFSGLSLVRGTAVIAPDFKTMVSQADTIFRGQVTNVSSEWTGEGSTRAIVTYVTFNVEKTLKGTATTPYVLRMLGGTVGDQTMEISGVPTFKVGDRTLLFVENNGKQFFPVVGIMHGYFRLKKDASTSKEIVLKYNGDKLGSTAEIDKAHQETLATNGAQAPAVSTPSGGTALQIGEFEAQIQKQLASPAP